MGGSKWLGLIGLMIITAPIGGILWVPLLFFGYKYVKLAIKLDFYTIYLAIRIPIWLLIQVPAHALKVGAGKITGFFEGVLGRFRTNTRGMGSLMILGLILYFWLMPWPGDPVSSVSQSISVLFSYILPGLVAALTFSGTIAGIWNFFSDERIARSIHDTPEDVVGAKEGVEGATAGLASNAASDIDSAKEAADKAKGVYDDIRAGETAAVEAKDLAAVLPSDMAGVLTSLTDSLPFLEGMIAGSTSLGPALIAVIVVLFVLLFVMVIQWAIVMFVFMSTLKVFMPLLAGPLMGALGLGAAYGDYIGQTASNQYFAGISFDEERRMVSQAGARIGCVFKGPSCLRQWRLNNTKRPGSEDVGEQYGLKIDRFRVGQGSNLDVAHKDTDYALPISFTISNPRRGLKGIDAKNVSYRLKVIDASQTYCRTGWIPVNGFDIREDASEPWKGNDIYPGTSASTGFQTLEDEVNGVEPVDEFTLEGCGMLQPALGSYKTVMLEVRYGYFSQSTLYFQAMSLQNLQANPDIQKEVKRSKTADTPVKAAINVNSPVLFDQEELETLPSSQSAEASQQFAIRATLGTDEYDLRYKVENLKVEDSVATEIAEDDECQFEEREENRLSLSGDAKTSILDKTSSRDLWFDSAQKPPIFGCVMRLSDPGEITPSGETLTMGVEANYTVALEEKIDSFRIYNSRCGARYNCPLLVTADYAKDDPINYGTENWMFECNGVDAGNGCSVVKGPEGPEWSRKLLTGNEKEDLDRKLEDGEVAVSAESISNTGMETDKAIGLRPDLLRRILEGDMSRYALVSRYVDGEKEVEKEDLEEDAPCNHENWKNPDDKVIVYSPDKDKCVEQDSDSASSSSTEYPEMMYAP